NDFCRSWIEIAKILLNPDAGKLGNGACKLDSGRTATDNDEAEQSPPLLLARGHLSMFEGLQHPTADKCCVVHALEAWRKGSPGVLTEVAVRRTGRDDEVVVGYAEPIGQHLAPVSVDAGHCRQHHLGIELVAENSPYGNGNVTR